MPRKSKSKEHQLTKTAKKNQGTKSTDGNNVKGDSKFTVEDVLKKAQDSIDVYDYDMAQRYCQKALEIDNDNIKVLELTGHVMMEVGNLEGAKQCYGRSVELVPDVGHLKYLYLGQLLDGQDSVNCFRKAIQVMLNSLEAQENKPIEGASNESPLSVEATYKDVSSAYLSIAELYMTDLCDESDAEDVCVANIKKAIEHDETNPEGYQVLADYHLVKGEIEEAKVQILKSISLWLASAQSLLSDDAEGQAVSDPVDCVPISPDAQLKAAKTLIEVAEYSNATDVLELLLDQDDSIVDAWYLLGWANYLQGDEYKLTAKYYLERCQEVSEKHNYEDEDVLAHVTELLQELSSITEDPASDPESDGVEDMEAD
ncbi:uncharacterized protein [Watersipora subatra]|uniref:uncharacterized protein n=1 Tax=Watersipora subatra TaxID=2589382 RepID=UPI00355B359E